MPCYYPLKGYVVGRDIETGKKIVRVVSSLVDAPNGVESFPVPCGHCIGCRLDYSRQWADRCMMELKYHERACFITLTYDDCHVPRRFYSGDCFGSPKPCFSLSKRDLQLFFKRLRKAFPENRIRYFGCGEYGPRTFRPHYHVILFGIDFDDKVSMDRKSSSGQDIFTSQGLSRVWSFPARNELGEYDSPNIRPTPAGIATVQPVTWETCAYTARYVTKKLDGPYASFYQEKNIDPPFCVMSRRPGIGRQYYDDHPEIWDYDAIYYATPDGGRKAKPSRYYKQLLAKDDSEKAEALSRVRMALAQERQQILAGEFWHPNYETYLDMEESILQSKIKSLKRSDF